MSNEKSTSNEGLGEKFEEIFGLLAPEFPNAGNTNFVRPRDAEHVLGKRFKSPFIPPLDFKPNMKEILDD